MCKTRAACDKRRTNNLIDLLEKVYKIPISEI